MMMMRFGRGQNEQIGMACALQFWRTTMKVENGPNYLSGWNMYI